MSSETKRSTPLPRTRHGRQDDGCIPRRLLKVPCNQIPLSSSTNVYILPLEICIQNMHSFYTLMSFQYREMLLLLLYYYYYTTTVPKPNSMHNQFINDQCNYIQACNRLPINAHQCYFRCLILSSRLLKSMNAQRLPRQDAQFAIASDHMTCKSTFEPLNPYHQQYGIPLSLLLLTSGPRGRGDGRGS